MFLLSAVAYLEIRSDNEFKPHVEIQLFSCGLDQRKKKKKIVARLSLAQPGHDVVNNV